MTDRRDIGSRLENWGRWAITNGSHSAACQTGAICENMRRAVEGSRSTIDEQRRMDEEDALRIEAAWRGLDWFNKELLRLFFVEMIKPHTRMNHGLACRMLSIPVRPSSIFVDHLRQAQAAIEAVLEQNNVMSSS